MPLATCGIEHAPSATARLAWPAWPAARLAFPAMLGSLAALNLGSSRSFDQPSVADDSGILPGVAKAAFILTACAFLASGARARDAAAEAPPQSPLRGCLLLGFGSWFLATVCSMMANGSLAASPPWLLLAFLTIGLVWRMRPTDRLLEGVRDAIALAAIASLALLAIAPGLVAQAAYPGPCIYAWPA